MHDCRRALQVAIALLVSAFVVSIVAGRTVGRLAEGPSALSSLGSSTTLIVVSLGLWACLGERRWNELGLVRPAGRWWGFVGLALVVGIAITLGIKLGHGTGMGKALKGLRVPVVLVSVIYGSFAEELFTRGWFQGFLEVRCNRQFHLAKLTISLPVLASGIAFGAMHLTLLSKGLDAWTIGFILTFTTTVGLIAARAREQTRSLLPAVITHLAGNVGGLLGGIVYVAIYAARFGQLPML